MIKKYEPARCAYCGNSNLDTRMIKPLLFQRRKDVHFLMVSKE